MLSNISMILSNITASCKLLFNKTKEYFVPHASDTNTSGEKDTESKCDRYYEKLSTVTQYAALISQPTNIIDNIWLGSAHNAANYDLLKQLEIKEIINVTKDIYDYYPQEFTYHKFEINDDDKANIDNILDQTYEIIDKIPVTDNILVHCFMGASRSCSVVIYYLMKKQNKTFSEALNFIKEKRNVVNPNTRFLEAIKKKFI